MTAPAVLECGHQDPLIQVRHGSRRRQRTEEAEHAGAPADLGGAGRAALDVSGQARGVGGLQLVEQERVDQVAGAHTIQAVADLRVRHNLYMT